LGIINKGDFACAIIYENGNIVFYNDRFALLFLLPCDLNKEALPSNIFEALEGD
jgi:hypothetical protein